MHAGGARARGGMAGGRPNADDAVNGQISSTVREVHSP